MAAASRRVIGRLTHFFRRLPRHGHIAAGQGVAGELHPVMAAGLGKEMLAVGVNGAQGFTEYSGDLAIAPSLSDEAQDFDFRW